MSSLNYPVPDLDYMDDVVKTMIGYRACIFQLKSSHLQLQKKNVFTFAPSWQDSNLLDPIDFQ